MKKPERFKSVYASSMDSLMLQISHSSFSDYFLHQIIITPSNSYHAIMEQKEIYFTKKIFEENQKYVCILKIPRF